MRQDGGDAETGAGIELGARLRYTRPGVTVEGAVRGLVAHEEAGYEEWGASGAIRIDPGTSGRGLSFRLTPAWGHAGSAAERLWGLGDARGLAPDAEVEAGQRLDAELGYGVGAHPGVVTPFASARARRRRGAQAPTRGALGARTGDEPQPRGHAPRGGERRQSGPPPGAHLQRALVKVRLSPRGRPVRLLNAPARRARPARHRAFRQTAHRSRCERRETPPAAGAHPRDTDPSAPSSARLSLEMWNDGTDVQVIGLNAEGRIVLAREGRMSSEPTLEGTGAIEGMLPADQLSFDSHGTLEHEHCATPSCARGIATVAESIVRASTMGAVEGAGEHTVMANLYPSTGAEGAPVPAPSEAIAALAANTPCKWRPVPIEALAPMPGVGTSDTWCGSAQRSTSCAKRHGPFGQTLADRLKPRTESLRVGAGGHRGRHAHAWRGRSRCWTRSRNAPRGRG